MKQMAYGRFVLCCILIQCFIIGMPVFGKVMPIEATIDQSPQLGDGYDSVFKARKFNCVAGELAEHLPRAVSGSMSFSSNLSYDEVLGNVALGPEIAVNRAFFNLHTKNSIISKHAANELSSTFHFFWTANGRAEALNHYSLQSSAPSFQGDQVSATGYVTKERLERLRAACGNEFISEIRYGAYLIVTLKVNFSTSQDKKAFEASLRLKSPFKRYFDRNSSLSDSEASNHGASLSGDLLTLANDGAFRSTSVQVVLDQVGGDPLSLSSMLGQDGLDGSVMTKCTSLAQMESCLEAFSEGVEYASYFIDSFASRDDNTWVPMYFVTTPYRSVSGMLGSELFLVEEIASDSFIGEFAEIDRFLDEVLRAERRANVLADQINSNHYVHSSQTMRKLEEAVQKAKEIRRTVERLYASCGQRVLSCEQQLKQFKASYPLPYDLPAPLKMLSVKVSKPRMIEGPVLVDGRGGKAFDHGKQAFASQSDGIKRLVIMADKRVRHVEYETNSGDVFTMGRIPSESEGYLRKELKLSPSEFISYLEAHASQLSGGVRLGYLKICKTDLPEQPRQVCVSVGTPSEKRYVFTVPYGQRVIGFAGRQGREIDRLQVSLLALPTLSLE